MGGSEIAGVVAGSVGAFFGILAWLSSLQWFKKYVGTMYRGLMWRLRGNTWYATRIGIASTSEQFELILHDVRRLNKIPTESITSLVGRCWVRLGTGVEPQTPLWDLLLEAARLSPNDTFDSMTLRFRDGCTGLPAKYFESFLDILHINGDFDLNNFPQPSLSNFIRIIEARGITFSFDKIFGVLDLLMSRSDNYPDNVWITFASMSDCVRGSPDKQRMDEFHKFIVGQYFQWDGNDKIYALKALGTLSRSFTTKRYKLPASIKRDLDECPVDFGEIQNQIRSFSVSTMFEFE